MASLNTRGYLENGMILWFMEGNRIDFTMGEFLEIVSGIRESGLFPYLESNRPVLARQFREIYHRDLTDNFEEAELEGLLEQSLLDLKDRLRLDG